MVSAELSSFTPYQLGDTTIEVLRYMRGTGGLVYVHLHSDEPVALAAAQNIVSTHNGTVVSINHLPERFVHFMHNNVPYSFDPNRMFSADGIRDTLRRTNPKYTDVGNYSEEAHRIVEQFAQCFIFEYLDGIGGIIAVHNNSDGDYHAALYVGDGPYAASASEVHIHDNVPKENFFYVIDKKHYEHLIAQGFNAVLQNHELVEDDGSLSVYCAKHGIPYINCEADMGSQREQERMLRTAHRLLAV